MRSSGSKQVLSNLISDSYISSFLKLHETGKFVPSKSISLINFMIIINSTPFNLFRLGNFPLSKFVLFFFFNYYFADFRGFQNIFRI